MKELENTFNALILKYSSNENLNKTLWQEIEENYSCGTRHYHHLTHLRNMIAELEEVKSSILNFDVLLFSVFYHDVIYDSSSNRNEENSAQFAMDRMMKIGLGTANISKIKAQILATKKHQRSSDTDINFLLDVDLSILGKNWEIYQEYSLKIRKEYSNYSDLLYKSGRKKVLQHFLESATIFKTAFFKNKYEEQARSNLLKEIEGL